MTYLTKEELGHIHEILVDACFQWQEPNTTYELRNKIKIMIDEINEREANKKQIEDVEKFIFGTN